MYKQTSHKYAKGLSLIEILVTVVVLSIGLLGIAGMQAQGVKYSHDSYARSQATMMANELIERMHANPDGVANGDYVTANGNADCSAIANEPTPNCTGTNTCDVTQLAALDVFRIRCGQVLSGAFVGGVVNQLPLGGINVTCTDSAPPPADTNPCTDDNSRTVTIFWQDPNDKNDANARLQVQVNARLL